MNASNDVGCCHFGSQRFLLPRRTLAIAFPRKKKPLVDSFSDDTLLDEDLGDEEYDLGNDEEEALLADDYELERVSILFPHCSLAG